MNTSLTKALLCFALILSLTACGGISNDSRPVDNDIPDAQLGFGSPDGNDDQSIEDDFQSFSVNAGIPQIADIGTTVFLIGSVKLPDDATIDSVEWTQLSGSSVSLIDLTTLEPSFVSPDLDKSENLVFKLTVTDSNQVTASDTVLVEINPLERYIFVNSVAVFEATGSVDIEFVLTRVSDTDVTVDFETQSIGDDSAEAGSDYVVKTGSVTFSPGQTKKTISISIVDDESPEGTEEFTLQLSNAIDAILFNDDPKVQITDVTPVIALFNIDVTTSESDGKMIVSLSVDVTSPLEIRVPFTIDSRSTAKENEDYLLPMVSEIVIPPNSKSGQLTIVLLNDDIFETDETIIIQLGDPGESSVLGEAQAFTVILTDDDDIVLTDTNEDNVEFLDFGLSVNEADKFVDVIVIRTGGGASALSVDITSLGISAVENVDYELLTDTLNWSVGDLTEKSVRINLLADAKLEGIEELELVLSNANGGAVGSNRSIVVSINDSDCINEIGNRITEDTTLNDFCYRVTRRLFVELGATLTIDPGVTLLFEAGIGLDIKQAGVLYAVGTEESPILFTGAVKTPGYWAGLQLTWSDSTINQLDYVTIEYGGGSGGNGEGNLVMYGNIALPQRMKLSNSTLRYSGSYGFYFSPGANVDLFSNVISTKNNKGPGYLSAAQVGLLDSASDYTGNTIDRIFVAPGGIDEAQTWLKLNVPYYMSSALSIAAPLIVDAGVTLIFNGGTSINVRQEGSLIAIGTAELPILFTGDEKIPGYWRGIQFTFSDKVENEIAHAIIEYGGDSMNGVANLTLFGTTGLDQRLKLSDTILRHSIGYGFEFSPGSHLDVFENVTSTQNELGPGLLPANVLHMLDGESDYSGNEIDRIFVEGDSITEDQTWPSLNVVYEMLGGVNINAHLTIEAGAEFYHHENTYLDVRSDGALTAVGTVDEPIIFTAMDEVAGYWRGIQFTFTQSVNNILEHTVVEYAGGSGGNGAGAVVLFGNSSLACIVTLNDNLIQHSGEFGLWYHADTDLTENRNSFNNNLLGDVFVE